MTMFTVVATCAARSILDFCLQNKVPPGGAGVGRVSRQKNGGGDLVGKNLLWRTLQQNSGILHSSANKILPWRKISVFSPFFTF
jgi:hypothetical protein